METIGEAYAWLRSRALPKGAFLHSENGIKLAQNEDDGGTGGVRRAIYTLLPAAQRRRLFFEMASSKEGLLRLRDCFGAPPYAFLHPADIYALNASAIGLRRTHLSYEYGSPIPPFGQVGGVLEDEVGNEYFLLPSVNKTGESDPLPLVDAIRVGMSPHLVMQISLKAHQHIPSPQRDLELRETSYHWRLRGRPARATLRVQILSTHTSGTRRRTAVLNTRLLSAQTSVDEKDRRAGESSGEVLRQTPKKLRDEPSAASADSASNERAEKRARLVDDVPPVPEFVTL